MKIIMLAGKSQKGKTTTLKLVYDRLSNNIKPIYFQEFHHIPTSDIECYPLYHHDKKIALCTVGDEWDYIKDTIIKFNCIGTDVLIIAFSEDSDDKKTDLELFKPDNLKDIQPHCVIQKRVSNDPNKFQTYNEKDCQAIIEHI
jgi:hypothetical protein